MKHLMIACSVLAASALPATAQTGTAQSGSVETRLRALEDKELIAQVLLDYGRHLDSRDLKSYAGLFAADGEWVGGFGAVKGRDQIQAFMEKNMGTGPNRNNSYHLMSNFVITVKGDTVWVMRDGALDIRQVRVVFRDAAYAYIDSGLSDSDRVVTTNLATVVDGVRLRTRSTDAAEAERRNTGTESRNAGPDDRLRTAGG